MADGFDIYVEEKERGAALRGQPRTSEPVDGFDVYERDQEQDLAEYKDSTLKSWLRTGMQIPLGIGQAVTYPLDLFQMLGRGMAVDPEEIDHIEMISEREGIPFDREKYMQAVESASSIFPTQSNLEQLIEESTGFPLQPKTKGQKLLRLASSAGKFAPGTLVQKGVAGATAAGTAAGLEQLGVPEPIAELGGLALSGVAAKVTPAVSPKIKPVTKPSGLPARRFEKIKEPRTVPGKKIEQIHSKLEGDFRKISDEIIKDSPISKTKGILQENPAFKAELGEQFKKVESLAEQLPEKIDPNKLKKSLLKKISEKEGIGFAPSEYDKDYKKFMNEFINEIPNKEIPIKDGVKQYRKTNASLSEAYDPSRSKAFNKAKKEALLDSNRVLADVMGEIYPDTEFINLFKDTNKIRSQIYDIESMNKFIDGMFDGEVKFKKGRKFFENANEARPFKRALGEENFPKFEQLMKDLLSSEKPAQMLKVAKQKGFGDLVETAGAFIIHPTIGKAKLAYDVSKRSYQSLVNALIDKPQYMFTLENGLDALKKGNFKSAEKSFNTLEKDVKTAERSRVEALGKFREHQKKNIKAEIPKSKETVPEKLYHHGTQTKFEKFEKTNDIGFHFSESPETAKEFALGAEKPGPGHVIEAQLNIKNPLRSPDLVNFSSTNLAEMLDKKGLKPRRYKSFKDLVEKRLGIDPFEGPVSKRPSVQKSEQNALNDIKNELKDLGYDSIVYENKFEGKKSDSYIVFDNKDIKQKKVSLFRNKNKPKN